MRYRANMSTAARCYSRTRSSFMAGSGIRGLILKSCGTIRTSGVDSRSFMLSGKKMGLR